MMTRPGKQLFQTWTLTRRVLRSCLPVDNHSMCTLLAIIDAADVYTGRAQLPRETLARRARCSVRRVDSAVVMLINLECMFVHRERVGRFLSAVNVYELNVARLLELEPATNTHVVRGGSNEHHAQPAGWSTKSTLHSVHPKKISDSKKEYIAMPPKPPASARTLSLFADSNHAALGSSGPANDSTDGCSHGATAPSPSLPTNPPPPVATSTTRAVIAVYAGVFERINGHAPIITGKTRAVAKLMAAQLTPAQVATAIENAFADGWFRANSGELTGIWGQINKYLATPATPVAPKNQPAAQPGQPRPPQLRQPPRRRIDPDYG